MKLGALLYSTAVFVVFRSASIARVVDLMRLKSFLIQ